MALYAYYVNGDQTGGKVHAIYLSRYVEATATWSERVPIRIDGVIDGNAVDPDLRVLNDGRIVLTYMRGKFGGVNEEAVPTIYQAWSLDGQNFYSPRVLYKPTLVTTTIKGGVPAVTDPSIVQAQNGDWLMAVSDPNASSAMLFASSNGVSYAATGQTLTTFSPDFQLLADGTLRIYYAEAGGIRSKSSSDDGVTWTTDAGFRLSGAYFDPSVFQRSDGTWAMLVKTSSTPPGTTGVSNPVQYHHTSLATSADGFSFVISQLEFARAASVPEGVEFSPVQLFTSKGAAYAPKSTPAEFLAYADGSYGLLFNATSGWSEQTFNASGVISGGTTKLSLRQVLMKESEFSIDINRDGLVGDTVAQVLAQSGGHSMVKTATGAYVLATAGVKVGDALSQTVLLRSTPTKDWSTKATPIDLNVSEDASTVSVLLQAGSGLTATYSEVSFNAESGVISVAEKKITSVSAKIAAEKKYGIDITQDYIGYVSDKALSASWIDNGSLYALYKTGKTWADANKYAASRGGSLVVFETDEEADDFYSALTMANLSSSDLLKTKAKDGGSAAYIWLGATDAVKEGEWRWTDGTVLATDNPNWGAGALGQEPDNYAGNQDHLALGLQNWPAGFANDLGYGNAGSWNDLVGTNRLFFVLEFEGIV